MSLPPYFVPRVPGVPGATVEQPDLTPAERRWRASGAVALGLLALGAAGGVVAVRLGALSSGVLAGALAVAFGVSVLAAVLLDVVVTLRPRPHRPGTRPGLRAASFFYLAALLCLVVTFAFLAV